MTKAKTKAAKSTKAAKGAPRGRKVEPLTAAQVALIEKEMKREDISNCEAVRNIAAKLANASRKAIRENLVGRFKMNPGTVNRQIQDGRASA